jgi:hypothetical protein
MIYNVKLLSLLHLQWLLQWPTAETRLAGWLADFELQASVTQMMCSWMGGGNGETIELGGVTADEEGEGVGVGIFTVKQKPNRTEPKFRFFGSSVRFRFLDLRILVFGIVIGFHRIPNRNTKKPNTKLYEFKILTI